MALSFCRQFILTSPKLPTFNRRVSCSVAGILYEEEKTMAKESLKKGDHVEWETPQGKTDGTVKEKLTSPTTIKNHKVTASKENPEYLVEAIKSKKLAAHKPEALKKTKKK